MSLGNNNDNNEAVYLNKLYDSAAGDNWKDNTNWKSKEPVCSWFGVTCEDGSPTDGEGVTQIDMNHNNLNGKIPPEIWKLPKLKQLNLRGNLLTSASFEELRTPTDKAPRSPIETIILSENHITDMKGIGYAGDTLTNLNLNKNQIDEELPIELFQLTNLETLFLAFNNILGTIPTLIGRLSKLSEVYAFNNRFTGQIPSEFGLLDNCQILGLGDNLLTGTLPTELNQMVNMRDLSIHHVQAADGQPKHPGLSGPLLTFGDMPFLTLLFLDGNSFTGTIPSDFLRHNNNLDTPVSVALSYNNITGALPKSLERFESLSIDLVGNRITEIPPELCEKGGWMGGLVEEYKCDAILCGKNSYSLEGRTIADDSTCQPCSDDYPYLGAETCSTDASQQSPWKVLAGFYLAMSGSKWTVRTGWDAFDILFDGGVAADLEAMNIDVCAGFYGVTCNEDGEVTRISLPKNEMFGSIPPTVFTLPKLEVFDLSNNNVEMKDLRSVGRAEGLSSLVLSNVKLDSISGVGDLKLLEQLYLDGLNIQGTLPDELFDLTNLRTLHLQHGSFAGTLPPLIGQLTQLQW